MTLLTVSCCAVAVTVFVSSAVGAGRVFHDDFESGALANWIQ